MEGPILSPDGSQTWTGTKWIPVESETKHTPEFRNPFQSQHSTIDIQNPTSPRIEQVNINEDKLEYIDVFKHSSNGKKWSFYWKILLALLSIAAICLFVYYPSVEAVLCILPTLVIILALLYGFRKIVEEYLGQERPIHTKIAVTLLAVGAIGVFVFTSLSEWGDPILGFLLMGVYIVPALLIYKIIIWFDEKVERLGWKQAMISAFPTLLKWIVIIAVGALVGYAQSQ